MSKNFIVVIIIIKRIIIFVKYNNLMPTYLEKPFGPSPFLSFGFKDFGFIGSSHSATKTAVKSDD